METTYEKFMKLAESRYSCRNYSSRTVDKSVLELVLNGARIAPSACNRQPWKFMVVTDEDLKVAVQRSYDRDWLKTAPAYIVAVGNHDESWHRSNADNKDHMDIDLAIASEHICLAAAALDLGTCWVCNFDPETLRTGLNIPENLEPVVIIPIGYPAEGTVAPKKTRKELGDIVEWL